MIETIKEALILYAPTVLCCVSSVVGFLKTAKQLKQNKDDITKSVEINNLKKEVKNLRETIACHTHYELKLIEQNREILKHENSKNEEIQENLQGNKLS